MHTFYAYLFIRYIPRSGIDESYTNLFLICAEATYIMNYILH